MTGMNRKVFASLGLLPVVGVTLLAACGPTPAPVPSPSPTPHPTTTVTVPATTPAATATTVAPTTTRPSTTTTPPVTTTRTTTPRPTTTSPASTTTTAPPAAACTHPDVYQEGDGGDYGQPLGPNVGPYFVHNNAWNWAGPGSGQHETLYACGPGNWWVDASGMVGTDVKTYPNVHVDVAGGDRGAPLSNWHTITSTFADQTPTGGGWDAAYDVWLNGLATDKSTEVMVWTKYHNQTPAGDIVGTYTTGGVTFDVWADHDGYVAYVARTPLAAGTVDLMAVFHDGIAKKVIPDNPVINQVDYGIEFCSTAGATQRFTVTDFSLTFG